MRNIVKISDGLGNQIFQYAFARNLQIQTGGKVYLDTRYINNEDRVARGEESAHLKNNHTRVYFLGNFKTTIPIADRSLLSRWDYLIPKSSKERMIAGFARAGFWPWQYKDEGKIKEGRILKSGKGCMDTYFQGYYFNLKYYDSIRTVLQKEIRLKKPVSLPKGLKNTLCDKNTVGVHIRRGDFIKLHYSISNSKYYVNAIKKIDEQVENPIYLFFSDDIKWVKRNIRVNGTAIYISDMGFDDCEEFIIMKNCKHHIIANSTFSYWAAYLNRNPKKIVIYPESWEKQNIIPNDWVGIPT